MKLNPRSKSGPLPRSLSTSLLAVAITTILVAPAATDALTLYVSLNDGISIDKVDSTGAVSLFATLPANSYPRGLAFDASGNLYAVDAGTDQISKITPGGVVSLFATLPPFSNSVGLAFDTNGVLYTTSENNNINRILQITSAGVVTTFATPTNNSLLDGLAFEGSGNLYAAQQGSDQIYMITPGGVVSLFATLPAGTGPDGLAFDAGGSLYVAGNPNKVYKVSPDGLTVGIFANLPSGSGPFGVAYDGTSGNFYVADGASGQINKVSPDGLTASPFAIGGISAPRFIAIEPAGVPKLIIIANGPNSVKVLWPNTGTFTLQQNNNLATTNWVSSGYTITNGFGTNFATITPITGSLFLRLSKP
jgi:sugar lactone lactonase YvrE